MTRANARPLTDYRRILVIKLGALGDFVQSLRAMAEIRRAHPQAKITLLTTQTYAELALASRSRPEPPSRAWRHGRRRSPACP